MDLLSASLLYGLLLYNVDPIHNHIMLAKDILCCSCIIMHNLGLLGFSYINLSLNKSTLVLNAQ